MVAVERNLPRMFPLSPVAAPIVHLDTVDSTNLYLKKLAGSGADIGTTVLADEQTAGRGRTDRKWVSGAGGLYCSILLEAREPRLAPELSFVAAIAVARTLRRSVPEEVEVNLKWPNDCLLGGGKVSGILCEVAEGSRCVVGIGINVCQPTLAEVENARFAPVTIQQFLGADQLSPSELFSQLRGELLRVYAEYLRRGFAFLRKEWEARSTFVGKKVRIDDGSEEFEAVFLGLSERGAMRVSSDRGERLFYSGEIVCFW